MIASQIVEQNMKIQAGGMIDQQAELYKQQGISFKGYNLAKGADSIAQIASMIVAEGGVPSSEIISTHSNIIKSLVSLGGLETMAGYSAVK